MIYAKITGIMCTNILEFQSEEQAHTFDVSLVKLQEGYGIGDEYVDGVWQHHTQTSEERIAEIKAELVKLDSTINRATEDLYELTQTTPYTTIQDVITQKETLRTELRGLEGGTDA